MDSPIILPNDFFAQVADVLRAGSEVKIKVQGNSMYPFLHNGDTITLQPYTGQDLPLYCAIFYRWQGHYMIHRLVSADCGNLSAMGDGNIRRIEHITRQEVAGVLGSCTHQDGTEVDCLTRRWLRRGGLWYKLRSMRIVLLKILKLIRY